MQRTIYPKVIGDGLNLASRLPCRPAVTTYINCCFLFFFATSLLKQVFSSQMLDSKRICFNKRINSNRARPGQCHVFSKFNISQLCFYHFLMVIVILCLAPNGVAAELSSQLLSNTIAKLALAAPLD